MFELAVGFVVGLVIGWNLLPQPDWVRDLWVKWIGEENSSEEKK